jgi:hypothetical protein
MKKMMWIASIVCLAAGALGAQDIAGDWAGTLKAGPAELRLVLHLAKAESGWKATLDSIDQAANGIPVSSAKFQNGTLTLEVDAVQGHYEGRLSGDTITGTWTQAQALPLEFHRGTVKIEHKPAKPSDIDGAWQGELDMGVSRLRIVFHILNTEDGLTATLDSPDQNATGLPVTAVTRSASVLKIEMKGLAAAFEGKISADLATIEGTFTQAGNSIPLALKHAGNK